MASERKLVVTVSPLGAELVGLDLINKNIVIRDNGDGTWDNEEGDVTVRSSWIDEDLLFDIVSVSAGLEVKITDCRLDTFWYSGKIGETVELNGRAVDDVEGHRVFEVKGEGRTHTGLYISPLDFSVEIDKEKGVGYTPDIDKKLVFNPEQIEATARYIDLYAPEVDRDQEELLESIYDDIRELEENDISEEVSRFGYLVTKSLLHESDELRVQVYDVYFNFSAQVGYGYLEGRLDSDGNIVVKYPGD